MLSILVPTYNYNTYPLVQNLHAQAVKLKTVFEIIVIDDCSTITIEENKLIGNLSNTTYTTLGENIGRSAIRNKLARLAKYEWLLFLDADVIPKSNNFIEDYISAINLEYDIIFGGLAYLEAMPDKQHILRWKYGKNNEQVDARKRNLNPYRLIVSGNFITKKTVFNTINSQLIIKKSYGLDIYFAALLKKNNINVLHINNEVYHNGIENSRDYLKKVEEFIDLLLWLYNNQKILNHDNKLLSTFATTKKLKFNYIMSSFYKHFNSKMTNNLLGKAPSIFLFQVYKLSYICHKDLKE